MTGDASPGSDLGRAPPRHRGPARSYQRPTGRSINLTKRAGARQEQQVAEWLGLLDLDLHTAEQLEHGQKRSDHLVDGPAGHVAKTHRADSRTERIEHHGTSFVDADAHRGGQI